MGDIAQVISFRGGNISGQGESGQGGQRQIGGAPHARLQHPAAPNGHPVRLAQIVDGESLAQSAQPPGLDVDDAAGVHFDGVARVPRRDDALVEAEGGLEFGLKFAVIPNVVFVEGLFDEKQVEGIERLERRAGLQGVGGVGVHLQEQVRKSGAHRERIARVTTRLDLDLDAPVALNHVIRHRVDKFFRGGLQSNRNAHIHFCPFAAKQFTQRFSGALAKQVPDGHFHARLGELVPADTVHAALEVVRVGNLLSEDERRDKILQDVPGGAGRFVAVARIPVRDAFAVAGQAVRFEGHEDALAMGDAPEGSLEGRDERHAEVREGEGVEFHSLVVV